MLETIAIIILVLWLFGFIGGFAIGWLVQALLVIAVVFLIVRVLELMAGGER